MAREKKDVVRDLTRQRAALEGVLRCIPEEGTKAVSHKLEVLLGRDHRVENLSYNPETGVVLGTLRYQVPETLVLVDFVFRESVLTFTGEPGYLDRVGLGAGLRRMGLPVPT